MSRSPVASQPRAAAGNRWTVVALVALTVLVRLVPALIVASDWSDRGSYHHMARAVLRDQDIYDVPRLFPYSPLSLFVPALVYRLSATIGLPFNVLMNLLPIAGDAGTAVLIFLLARRRRGLSFARWVAFGFALNPVSVLISGFHGNLMPFSVFFAFWAFYLLDAHDRDRAYVLSALALGIAIGWRGWAVLLLPFLVRPTILTMRQRAIYVALAAMPSLLTLAPYLAVNFAGISREVFDYRSTPDFGWVAIWRYYHYLGSGNHFMPWPIAWVSASRFYYLAAYAVLVALAYVRPRLHGTDGWISAALLLNYTMVGGLAAQYLGWVIPFLIFQPRFYVVFSAAAAVAITCFYLIWHPMLLFGLRPAPFAYSAVALRPYYLGILIALWLLGVAWLVWFALGGVRGWRADPASDAGRGRAVRLGWLNAGVVILGLAVAAVFLMELRYLQRSRPPRELPATLAWSVIGRGSQPGQFSAPGGVAVDPSGNIYVPDAAGHRVQRFSPDGKFAGLWQAANGTVPLREPSDVTAGSAGQIYTLDAAGAIYQLHPDGVTREVAALAPHSVYSPRGLAIDAERGRFYVADTGKGRILVLGLDGTLIAAWGGHERDTLVLEHPNSVSVDHRGNVYVAEVANSRIRKLAPDGALLAEWRVKGEVSDLDVGPDDRVYVTAADRPRLWIYDSNGGELGQVAAMLAEQRVLRPRGVAAFQPGEVVIATEASLVRLSVRVGS